MSLTKVSYSLIKGAKINVKDFGVIGDGVTDDTAAIQAAINSAAGKTIYFPSGTYLCSQLILTNNTNIIGETTRTTIIKSNGTDVSDFIRAVTKNNITIDSVTIDFANISSVSATSAIGLIDCDFVVIKNSYIKNFNKVGIGLNACNSFWIDSNYIERSISDTQGVNESILVTESGFGTSSIGFVTNNICKNSGTLFRGNNIIISGNIITDWKYGAGIGVSQNLTTININISNNYIRCSYSGVDSDGFSCKGIENWGYYSKIHDNTIFEAGGAGIFIGGNGASVQNNTIYNCGLYTGETNAGIELGHQSSTWNASNSVVTGNTCFDTLGASGTQDYGIIVSPSSIANTIIIANNKLYNNKTGSLLSTVSQTFVGENVSGYKTFDFPSITSGSSVTTSVTVTGASVGDYCQASLNTSLQGLSISAYCSSSNTVDVTLTNNTGSSIDLASTTVKATAYKTLF